MAVFEEDLGHWAGPKAHLLDGGSNGQARGVPGVRSFAERWFDHHWATSSVSNFQGPKGRVFRAGRIPVTTYAGHFGLDFVGGNCTQGKAHLGMRHAIAEENRQAGRNQHGVVEGDLHPLHRKRRLPPCRKLLRRPRPLAGADRPVVAVHIDHGLQAQSGEWASHCAAFSESLGIGFQCRKVEVQLDFIPSSGSKIYLTQAAEAQAEAGHDILAFDQFNTHQYADKLVSVMETYAGAVNSIGTFLERTSGIEDFDPEDLNQIEVHFKP